MTFISARIRVALQFNISDISLSCHIVDKYDLSPRPPIFSPLHRYISSFHFHSHYSRYTDVSELCKSNNVQLSYVKAKPSERKTLTQHKQPAQQSTLLRENSTTMRQTNRNPCFVMEENVRKKNTNKKGRLRKGRLEYARIENIRLQKTHTSLCFGFPFTLCFWFCFFQ